jgi:hypothetical protein
MNSATKKTERNEVRTITDEERNAKVAKHVSRQSTLRRKWQEAIDQRALAQSNEKQAKEDYLASCADSEALLRDESDGLPFQGDEKPPVEIPDVFDEKGLDGFRLMDLKLSSGIISKLTAADDRCGKPQLVTVGDLKAWLVSDPGNRIANINGLTENSEKKIAAAIADAAQQFSGEGTEAA